MSAGAQVKVRAAKVRAANSLRARRYMDFPEITIRKLNQTARRLKTSQRDVMILAIDKLHAEVLYKSDMVI